MKVLVCGGRNFDSYEAVCHGLDAVLATYEYTTLVIIHGAASGVDKFAGEWAHSKGIPVERYPANWRKHGRAAGPLRNQQMLDEGKPDLVVYFPGGVGTADMVARAEKAGVRLHKVHI